MHILFHTAIIWLQGVVQQKEALFKDCFGTKMRPWLYFLKLFLMILVPSPMAQLNSDGVTSLSLQFTMNTRLYSFYFLSVPPPPLMKMLACFNEDGTYGETTFLI